MSKAEFQLLPTIIIMARVNEQTGVKLESNFLFLTFFLSPHCKKIFTFKLEQSNFIASGSDQFLVSSP